jgi:hypothetical protein
MNTRAWLWAFWGIPGLREIALVLLVTLVLYGRSGLQIARRGRGLGPWLSLARRVSAPPSATRARAQARPSAPPARGSSRRGDRVFWFLAIVAAAAVAAWIVTRAMIVGAPKLSH